jgi:threonine/homoserine/homoserine lactone efflux protein
MLWIIIALTQTCIYGGVALAAAQARGWLVGRPAAAIMASRAVGVVLVVAAVFTGVEGWRSL